MDFREDTLIYPVMIELSACLCREIDQSGLPTPCSCGLIAGELTADYCGTCVDNTCGGQAWVRFVDSYPTTQFPTPSQVPSNCYTPWAFTIEMGIIRCKPVGKANGARGYTPPSLEQQVDAIRLQTADMAAMRRALQCCFGTTDRNYVIGNYQPVGPEADCLGGAYTITVGEF
jgi:hypothetical protein